MNAHDLNIFLEGWVASIKLIGLHYRQYKVDFFDETIPRMSQAVLSFSDENRVRAVQSGLVQHLADAFRESMHSDPSISGSGQNFEWVDTAAKSRLIKEIEAAVSNWPRKLLLIDQYEVFRCAKSLYPSLFKLLFVHRQAEKLAGYHAQAWLSEMLVNIFDMCDACWDLETSGAILSRESLIEDLLWNEKGNPSCSWWGHSSKLFIALVGLYKKACMLDDKRYSALLLSEIEKFRSGGPNDDGNSEFKEGWFVEIEDYRSGLKKAQKRFLNRHAISNACSLGVITAKERDKKIEQNEQRRLKRIQDTEEGLARMRSWHEDQYHHLRKAVNILAGEHLDLSNNRVEPLEVAAVVDSLCLLGRYEEALAVIRTHNVSPQELTAESMERQMPNQQIGRRLFYVLYKAGSLPTAEDIINILTHSPGFGMTRSAIGFIGELVEDIDAKIQAHNSHDAYQLLAKFVGVNLVSTDIWGGLHDVMHRSGRSGELIINEEASGLLSDVREKLDIIDDALWYPQYRDAESGEWVFPLDKWFRNMENETRERIGLPPIGEGWVTETMLFNHLREAFPDEKILAHAKPDWLSPQHLDIYFPDHNVAVEYQGEQHFEAIEVFGGDEGLRETQERDRRKKALCVQNECELIYVLPGYELSDVIKTIRNVTLLD